MSKQFRILVLFLLFPGVLIAQEVAKEVTKQTSTSTYIVYAVFAIIFLGVLYGTYQAISKAAKTGEDPGHYLMKVAAKNKVLGLEVFLIFLNIVEMLVPATIENSDRDPLQALFLHVVIAAGGIWLGLGIYRNVGEALQAYEEWTDLDSDFKEEFKLGNETLTIQHKDVAAQAIKNVYKFYTVHEDSNKKEYKVYSTDKWVKKNRRSAFFNELMEVVSSVLASLLIPMAVVWLVAKGLSQADQYWNFISGPFNFTALNLASDTLATSCVVMTLHLITIVLLVIRSISLNGQEAHPYDIEKITLIEQAKQEVLTKQKPQNQNQNQNQQNKNNQNQTQNNRQNHVGSDWDSMTDDSKKSQMSRLDNLFNTTAKTFVTNTCKQDLRNEFCFGNVSNLPPSHPRNVDAILFSNLETAYAAYLNTLDATKKQKLSSALPVKQMQETVEQAKKLTADALNGVNGMKQLEADSAIKSLFNNIFSTWHSSM